MAHPGTLLVVEQAADAPPGLVELLSGHGFQVRTAGGAEAALAALRAEPPDLVLAHLRLPPAGAFELLARLREDEAGRRVPVLLYGDHGDAPELVSGLERGAADFLLRPFREAELVARLRSQLELVRLRDQLERRVADQGAALATANEDLRAEVAERRQAQSRLARAEERFRTIYEESSLGLAWYGARGEFQQANPSFLGVFAVRDPGLVFSGNLFEGPELPEEAKDRLRRGLTVVQELPYAFPDRRRRDRGGAPEAEVEYRLLDLQILPVGQGTDGLEGFLVQVRDVTDRRRSERALRESQAQLASIYDAVADPVFLVGRDGDRGFRFLSVNRAFQSLTGLGPEAVLGRRVEEVLTAATQGQAVAMYRRAVETRATVRWEETADYPVGRITGEISISPIFDAQGRCTHLAGSVRDVTARRTQAAILEARDRLSEGSQGLDLEGLLRATLDEAEQLTGSVIGFYHFVDADQDALRLQAWSTRTEQEFCTAVGKGSHYPVSMAGVWADALRTGAPVIHNDYESHPARRGLPEGHARVIRELVVPVSRGGRIVAVLGVGNKPLPYVPADTASVQRLADLAWDLAERKRAEEDLRQSRWRLALVADHTYDWEFWVDPQGAFVYSSPSCERITGHAPGELATQADLEALIHPEDLPRWRAHLHDAEAPGGHGAVDFRIRHRDGGLRRIAHVCQPVYEGGRYLGHRGSNREVPAE